MSHPSILSQVIQKSPPMLKDHHHLEPTLFNAIASFLVLRERNRTSVLPSVVHQLSRCSVSLITAPFSVIHSRSIDAQFYRPRVVEAAKEDTEGLEMGFVTQPLKTSTCRTAFRGDGARRPCIALLGSKSCHLLERASSSGRRLGWILE